MEKTSHEVAIIGAGLGGAALALALHQRSISCRLYESRGPNSDVLSSGVVLTPNGCQVLDSLGVLQRIRPKCYQTNCMVFKNDKNETVEKTMITTEELYGYRLHRLYRRELLVEMKAMLEERGIPIEYHSKFENIMDDTAEGVTFQVSGRTEHAALLIGADGIHSTVRKYLTSFVPAYTGVICVYGHIPTNSVQWPEEFERAVTLQGKPGVMFMIPEVADGSHLMVGQQLSHPELDRAGWDMLAADKDKLRDFFRKDYELWNDTAKSVVDQMCAHKENLLLWPYFRMPQLDHWASATGRVIIIGDAAHAMPPSSGQGVNQALEDAYTLPLLLSLVTPQTNLKKALDHWQGARQSRIEEIIKMAMKTNIKRRPEAERLNLEQAGVVDDSDSLETPEAEMAWLYGPNLDQDVVTWVQAG